MQDGLPPQQGDGPWYQPPQSPPPHGQQPPYGQPGSQQPGYQQPQYQQPGYQPPGQQPDFQNAPRKRRMPTWLLLLLMVGGIVIAVGGCIGFFVFQAVSEINRSNDFLAAWDSADYAEVETLLEPSCGITADELRDLIGPADISDYTIDSVEVVNGVTSTSGTITFDGFDQRTIEIQWRNDKVCFLDIGAAP